MKNLINLKCPVCNKALNKVNNSYLCENKHTHDIAKEGYVNLLLAQHKRSKNPGDSDEMIRSRQSFLNKEYYKTLSNAIVQEINLLPQTLNHPILDVGCGEGYYLQGIVNTLTKSKFSLFGIDISKSAVKLAGKRKMGATLCVASAYDLPFFSESFSTIISVFSPVMASEVERLLKTDGEIIMVGPGEEHLKGLTAYIYDEILPHKGNYSVIEMSEHLTLKKQVEIKEEIIVKQEDILDLLRMTPYYWQLTIEKKKKIEALSELKTSIHFYIRIYQKIASLH